MAEKIEIVSESDFESVVINSDIPVLVDFWAVWCGPCQMITPSLENMVDIYEGKLKIVKVNVDESQSLSAKYGVMSIPTLLLFKGGDVKETIVGAVPQERIEAKVKGHL